MSLFGGAEEPDDVGADVSTASVLEQQAALEEIKHELDRMQQHSESSRQAHADGPPRGDGTPHTAPIGRRASVGTPSAATAAPVPAPAPAPEPELPRSRDHMEDCEADGGPEAGPEWTCE